MAQDHVDSGSAEQPGQASRLILDCLQSQVALGEDLTAAMLVAHGRLARQAEDETGKVGARLVALRVNRQTSSFELAWVGPMAAYLARKKEVLTLTPVDEEGVTPGATKTNGLMMTSTRVEALGLDGRVRPIIHRKLGHAQSGDTLVLVDARLNRAVLCNALSEGMAGIWSFAYKARKTQQILQTTTSGEPDLPVLLCQSR